MRITGGQYRNKKLNVPSGDSVRPTSDRMRQSLFNMLHHAKWAGDFDLKDATVLDIFCGSGSLGLEALSHGAKQATFVDLDTSSIKQNSQFLPPNTFDIIQQNAQKLTLKTPLSHTLVFIDPPYHKDLVTPSLKNLVQKNYLADKALVIIECEKSLNLNTDGNIEILDRRDQGQSTLYVARYYATI